MGNDGGSIPKRRELVKEAARARTTAEVKETQHSQQEYYWSTDPISRLPLSAPVVSDCAGKLYNKDTILEFLVEGRRAEEAEVETRGAVRSLRDVVEVRFEGASSTDGEATTKWKCPVTGDRLGAGSKAVYLIPCGHAFSSAAIKEVFSGDKCIVCDAAYAANDVIPILPTAELDVARLSLRAKTLKENGLSHSLKKAGGGGKKRKKREEDGAAVAEDEKKIGATNGHLSRTSTPVNGAQTKAEIAPTTGGIKDAATASLAAKVIAEQGQAKKRKTDNENLRSLFSDKSAAAGKNVDFMTRGFSIPANAKR
ncbi:Rtf2 RING-finger-domain-containing protein [Neohortaea acidophila]|uniref:Rtf2 RING-finger-domain-containing protein n=1 Tax=Neohortaea acidophila TaxID=245834 RepID=A0A6A6Q652_9PEZI|nr:Rtf2 RING-finger-domain-containing protein [Neohortaea acidophila]KAF2487795.1 Rtf2 RING-finger-domain-containing protein [Neohortaea acidophila]